MAEKSIVNDLKKIGRIITNPIGKSSLKNEKIVAVDIQIESITIALMQYGKKWKIDRVLHKTFILLMEIILYQIIQVSMLEI